MASVYIIVSKKIDSYYIGSCHHLSDRLIEHQNHKYSIAFTNKANDWELFFSIDNITQDCARKIERHIKSMKSKTYIKNLKVYPEMTTKLKMRFL